MKRTQFKSRSAKLGAKRPLRRTKLRLLGHSSVAEDKRTIQALLREIVMLRDGGCILRKKRHCNNPVLQADHLISRSNSATYADSRLVVCVCRACHGWKSLGSNVHKGQYDALVKSILPKDRVALWDKCEKDSWKPKRTSSHDWKLAIVALKQELKELKDKHERSRKRK